MPSDEELEKRLAEKELLDATNAIRKIEGFPPLSELPEPPFCSFCYELAIERVTGISLSAPDQFLVTYSEFATSAEDAQLTIAPGDILIQQSSDGMWHTVRILEVDKVSDGTSTAHCLSYELSGTKPTMVSVAELGVRISTRTVLEVPKASP